MDSNLCDGCQVTPLGAAYVEALPDRRLAVRIQRRFKTHAECPASAMFTAEEVRLFYWTRGVEIRGVERRGKVAN